jgi:hypothetical protein
VSSEVQDDPPWLEQIRADQTLSPEVKTIIVEVVALIKETVGPYLVRINENANRSTALIANIKNLEDETAQEVLRALVVLTHAHLEDFLRTLAIAFLPTAGEKFLNDVPLMDISPTGRPEKFFLGKLVRHRGKKVDDLIHESVVQAYDRKSINSVDDIATLLESVGFKVSGHSDKFGELEAMMRRRHLIVHRADRVRDERSERDVIQRVDPEQVRVWIAAVHDFVNKLLLPIMTKQVPLEEVAQRMGIDIKLQERSQDVNGPPPAASPSERPPAVRPSTS